jgi:hypothetical protein
MQGSVKLRNDRKACKYDVPQQLLITSTGGPTQVAAAGTFFRIAYILAVKTLSGTANTGTVKLGWNSAASSQPLALATGSAPFLYQAPVGATHDLGDLWISVASSGDGVVILYS